MERGNNFDDPLKVLIWYKIQKMPVCCFFWRLRGK